MSIIPDFDSSEIDVINKTLQERYGKSIELQMADSELRLDPDATQLTLCPTVYWKHDECNFVICKIGKSRYHCLFYYSANEQVGTGKKEYDDILECVVSLVRVQADYELERQGLFDK